MFSIHPEGPACMQIGLINKTKTKGTRPQTNTPALTCLCEYTATSILFSFAAILGCHMITSMSLLLWLCALPLTRSETALPIATQHNESILQSDLLPSFVSHCILHARRNSTVVMTKWLCYPSSEKRPVNTDTKTFMAAG